MKCAYCGEDTSREWYDHKGRKISSFPFKCEYCGLVYCSEHRLPERHACPGIITGKRSWDIFSRFRRGALQKPQQSTPLIHSSEPIKPQHEALSEFTETYPTKEKPEINEEQEPIETSWTRDEDKPIQHESKFDYEPIPIHDLKPKKESNVFPKKCSRCNITSPLYQCHYCGNFFCDEHILPEDHACKHILEDKHEKPIRAHAPVTQEEAKLVPQKNLIPLIGRLVAAWVLLIGLHQILWMKIHLLREYPLLYRIVTGGEYVAILGVIVLIVLLYRHNKRPLGPWDVPQRIRSFRTTRHINTKLIVLLIVIGIGSVFYLSDPTNFVSNVSLSFNNISIEINSFIQQIQQNNIIEETEEPINDMVGQTKKLIDVTKVNEYKNYYFGLVKTSNGTTVNSYGNFIVLINNKNATNPTYSQLLKFLKTDKTDEYSYVRVAYIAQQYFGSAESHVNITLLKQIIDGTMQPNSPRICADFAEMLHNNAEIAGYRCAYISIDFEDGGGHALNAFNTTDKGLIYIDDTGVVGSGPSNCDKIIDLLKIDKSYIPRSLFPEPNWNSTWENMGIVTEIEITWDGVWNGD